MRVGRVYTPHGIASPFVPVLLLVTVFPLFCFVAAMLTVSHRPLSFQLQPISHLTAFCVFQN